MPRDWIESGIQFLDEDRPNESNGSGENGANLSLHQRLMYDVADLAGR
jgi:hypothetical protein